MGSMLRMSFGHAASEFNKLADISDHINIWMEGRKYILTAQKALGGSYCYFGTAHY